MKLQVPRFLALHLSNAVEIVLSKIKFLD